MAHTTHPGFGASPLRRVVVPPQVRQPAVRPAQRSTQRQVQPPVIIEASPAVIERKTHASKLFIIAGGAIFVAIASIIFFFTRISGSPYNIETSISKYNFVATGERGYSIRTNIEGPAKKIVVSVKTPKEKVFTKILHKENLVGDNAGTIVFTFLSLPKGEYKVTLKDFESERIIGEKFFTVQKDLLKQTQGISPPAPLSAPPQLSVERRSHTQRPTKLIAPPAPKR